jgi:predicted Zn-dependent protease with MMP-like domain
MSQVCSFFVHDTSVIDFGDQRLRPYMVDMTDIKSFHEGLPSLAEFEGLTEQAWQALPQVFRDSCGQIDLFVADFADSETLAAVGLDNKHQLSGVYVGVDLTRKSHGNPMPHPARVTLFRGPILAEWVARGDVTLQRLISHVLVHEIGHHFGFSDEAMHAIESHD